MSLTEEDRMKSLELVKAFTSSSTKPLFLAGDMNAEPESGFIKELQKDFQILSNPKQHTFPAPDPKETIDYIATLKQNAKGFAVISAKVINDRAFGFNSNSSTGVAHLLGDVLAVNARHVVSNDQIHALIPLRQRGFTSNDFINECHILSSSVWVMNAG